MKLKLLTVLFTVSGAVTFADDWKKLDTVGINRALTSRVLQFEAGAIQNFFKDRRTLYETPRATWGKWDARGNRYCSIWPPLETWTCYDVHVSDDGLKFRFISDDLLHSEGRYIDLN